MHAAGLISDVEWHAYSAWADALGAAEPHGVVYLRCPPETCMSRASARARDGEAGALDLAYLERLHGAHEAYVDELLRRRRVEVGGSGAPDVLVLDASLPGEAAVAALARHVQGFAARVSGASSSCVSDA
jgi:deoxyadenosine/deoxycytidine kinase